MFAEEIKPAAKDFETFRIPERASNRGTLLKEFPNGS
jgi:hypothetical protein